MKSKADCFQVINNENDYWVNIDPDNIEIIKDSNCNIALADKTKRSTSDELDHDCKKRKIDVSEPTQKRSKWKGYLSTCGMIIAGIIVVAAIVVAVLI